MDIEDFEASHWEKLSSDFFQIKMKRDPKFVQEYDQYVREEHRDMLQAKAEALEDR